MRDQHVHTFSRRFSDFYLLDFDINDYAKRKNCVPVSLSQVATAECVHTTVIFLPKFNKEH